MYWGERLMDYKANEAPKRSCVPPPVRLAFPKQSCTHQQRLWVCLFPSCEHCQSLPDLSDIATALARYNTIFNDLFAARTGESGFVTVAAGRVLSVRYHPKINAMHACSLSERGYKVR